MVASTTPETPRPRPRVFFFSRNIEWPAIGVERLTEVSWYDVLVSLDQETYTRIIDNQSAGNKALARDIIRVSGGQPRKILRALRRIQAATAWCYARAEGRKRQAAEIVRQQQAAVAILETEKIAIALKK